MLIDARSEEIGGYRWHARPRAPALALLIFVSAAILVSGFFLLSTMNAARDLRGEVARTTLILSDLRDVRRAVTDAETGQRGYILTGDASYLYPYEDAIERLPASFADLERSISGASFAQETRRLSELEALVEAKFDELAETIRLFDSGRRDASLALIRSNLGQTQMSRIRILISQLEGAQEARLNGSLQRLADAEARVGPILLALAISVLTALTLGLWQIIRAVRGEAALRDVIEIRKAHDRADLLSHELNHRVKNLFAVISSIAAATIRREKDPAIAATKVQERIRALSLAHEITQGTIDNPMIDLEELIRTSLRPHEQFHERLSISGPATAIGPTSLTPLGMILHELATNAVKYGAWSGPKGRLSVDWSRDGQERVKLIWRESGASLETTDPGEGFGSRMMKMAASQLGGSIEREWKSDGVDIILIFPLPPIRQELPASPRA